MVKYLIQVWYKYVFAIVLTHSFIGVSAQPVASFSMSKTSGCNPLSNVQFTDLSTGNPTSWLWKKNGVQFSTLQNPTATFTTTGTISISLTATNSSGSSTTSKNITIYSNPTANFTASGSTSGCLPHAVSFQDNSTSPGASINSRLWTFGDGGGSMLVNPSHSYTLAGNFPVSLKVVDNHGCEDVKQIPNYIQVFPLPTSSFSSSSVRQSCSPPLTVTFTNSSSGGGTLTYLWTFGDGNTSTSATPSHTYTSFGVYDVSLKVTDQNGCSKTSSYAEYVKIVTIQASYSVSNDSICIGDSITFYDNSSGALAYNWSFGDGQFGGGKTVSHIYLDSGWHVVKLVASVAVSGCADSISKMVYIQRPVASFTPVPDYICEVPTWVHYQNTSVNDVSHYWRHGIFCPGYTQCGKSWVSDSLGIGVVSSLLAGVWGDTLVVVSSLGCRDTSILDSSIIVNFMVPGPVLSQSNGCRPYTIDFSASNWPYSPFIPTSSPPPTLTSTKWFIDDTLYSTMPDPPNLTITDTGVWMGYLVIENSFGCRDSNVFKIVAGDKPTADFYMVKDTICANELDSAISLSQDTVYINEYIWNTSPVSQIASINRNGLFDVIDTGFHSVQHIVVHHGCADTLVKNKAFYVSGPIVDILTASPFSCTDSTRIHFNTRMVGVSHFKWNFGDSTIPDDSVNMNPVVTFSKQGFYTVSLTAYNADSSCTYVDWNNTWALPTKSKILSDTSTPPYTPFPAVLYENFNVDTVQGCAPLTVSFMAFGSPGIMVADYVIEGQLYSGFAPDSFITHTFAQRGYYDVYMIGYDTVGNCVDTDMVVVGVYQPIADFVGMPSQGCTPLGVVLKETVNSLNPIVKYNWKVGNDVGNQAQFTKTYAGLVSLDAQLAVSDTFGCRDTILKKDFVQTSTYTIYMVATGPRQICAGDSIGFVETFGQTALSYKWYFGDGDSSILPSPFHRYNDSGVFDVKLVTENATGCVKTHLRGNYVEVQKLENVDFTADKTDSTCYPLPVHFTADSSMSYYNENSFYYILGDYQAASNYPNPFYNYVRPGSYTVSLIVTSTFGCKDTVTKQNYINISGPYGEMSFTPDSICRGDSVQFKLINPLNVTVFGWDFGDGSGVLGKNPVSHTYTDSFGFVFPNLVLTDTAGGCAKTFSDTVYIFETIARFTFKDTSGCVAYDPEFKNTSTMADSYHWDFGDGATTTVKNATRIYYKPGKYRVELRVQSNIGCKDTAVEYFSVYPLPDAFAERDTLICEGDSVPLFSSGGLRYSWTPPSSLTDGLIKNPIAFPKSSSLYVVEVTDIHDCIDTASVRVLVQNPIHVNLNDLSLIVGDKLVLTKAYAGPGVRYKWVPPFGLSCDTCATPLLTALESTTYTVTISDTNDCFDAETSFYLDVRHEYTLDVPTAFTPNGDGVNDVVYVRGWGLLDLITFKIFNRWGELVFESEDLEVGWDGTYKSKLQDVETYVYYVEALTYGNEILTKKGNINLLR